MLELLCSLAMDLIRRLVIAELLHDELVQLGALALKRKVDIFKPAEKSIRNV